MAILLKGKPLADRACEAMSERVRQWRAEGVEPTVAVLLAEGDPASAAYAAAKRRLADKLGFRFELIRFGADVAQTELIREMRRLNGMPDVHGIMVELPLPPQVDAGKVAAELDPLKDIDGIAPASKLACMENRAGLRPATPQSCIRLLKESGFGIGGKHAVVLGRGETVGRPLTQMLLHEQATVTVCHSRTPDLAAHLKRADIAIAAVGKLHLITPDWVHPGLVLIDAGINETADGAGIGGDVRPDVAGHVRAISPVPGGVGTLTTAILFENALRAMELQRQEGRALQ